LFDILSATVSFLEAKGIDYKVAFGTLLGAVRDQDIIPWTGDVDMSTNEDGMDALVKDFKGNYHYGNDPLPGGRMVRGCEAFPGEAELAPKWVIKGNIERI
jgi:hypothetical protein